MSRISTTPTRVSICFVLAACLAGCAASTPRGSENLVIQRLPQDEVIYFVLPDRFDNGDPDNDRGGLSGGREVHGFDPTDRGFYQGGDLAGLIRRLDYIQDLGATAVWLTPIFKNKAVQTSRPGEGGEAMVSAGYHGYWITDFLDVDPHLGVRREFREFVDAAHARGMKVYMDIITNHTADVILYRECHDPDWQGERAPGCPYRSVGDYPWTTRGGPDGPVINDGFLGDDPRHITDQNFAHLVESDYAYTPYVPAAEAGIKNPAWLNDLRYYHNRGNTAFKAEDSLYGDFIGLDDINTQHPRVMDGFIEIYKQWISDFRIDGFRIDTTKHVRPEFWQRFIPAILAYARSLGIAHFHVFGEVYDGDPAHLARWTREGMLPSALDFAFQSNATAFISGTAPAQQLRRMYEADVVYPDGLDTAAILPTFLGNHDMGRFAQFVRDARPGIEEEELYRRTRLGHALMIFSRGVPVIYYGDEQGFVSDSGDLGARESMFPSRTAVHADNDLIGSDATPADDNFDRSHPLYRSIREMTHIRLGQPALRRGQQLTRHADLDGGLFVFSRLDAASGTEILVAINADTEDRTIAVPVDGLSKQWTALMGECPTRSAAVAAYALDVPALDAVVCRSAQERAVH